MSSGTGGDDGIGVGVGVGKGTDGLGRSTPRGYAWAARGDVNAFFGLMLDNIGVMILMTALLGGFGVPVDFIVSEMIPGTAAGVLFGDLVYTVLAFRLARRTGRTDVTAMPLGLDTPSTFGTPLLIMGPAFLAARGRGLDPTEAARHAWYLGMSLLMLSGLFKLACSFVSDWVRAHVPRAGLLGSLTAIALVLISFLPLLEIVNYPISGLVALLVILITLSARWELPGRFPGALASLLVGCALYYGMWLVGLGPGPGGESGGAAPSSLFRPTVPFPFWGWWGWVREAENFREILIYLPIALPMALATVVGGIDCTESAATVGDEYSTKAIIATEGFAGLLAGFLGGVIQTTPYIGHPAYKAMGSRAAYTLATAVFVGGAGILGYFEWIFFIIPKATVFPILVFVGVEITSSSFRATPRRHYPALAFACVPALAYLALIQIKAVLAGFSPAFQNAVNTAGIPIFTPDQVFTHLTPGTQHVIQTLTVLSGGFIVTSLLWGMALAHLVDRRMTAAAVTFLVAGLLSLIGVMHSPLPSSAICWPWEVRGQLEALGRWDASSGMTPWHWFVGYVLVAGIVVFLRHYGHPPDHAAEEPETPHET